MNAVPRERNVAGRTRNAFGMPAFRVHATDYPEVKAEGRTPDEACDRLIVFLAEAIDHTDETWKCQPPWGRPSPMPVPSPSTCEGGAGSLCNGTRYGASRNRSRVEGNKCTDGIEPRSDFPGASVDPTEARNDILSCFGRSDRSAQGFAGRELARGRNYRSHPGDLDRFPYL
jgi:hypothetical protein